MQKVECHLQSSQSSDTERRVDPGLVVLDGLTLLPKNEVVGKGSEMEMLSALLRLMSTDRQLGVRSAASILKSL